MVDLKKAIRTIDDFPKKGIHFRDISPLVEDGHLLQSTVDALLDQIQDLSIDKIAAADARGFYFASAMATRLGIGFIPVRKKGKLPSPNKLSEDYDLEYGTATIEINADAIHPGEKILIFDDLLATGGTAKAMINLVERAGGIVVGCEFVIDLVDLGGRKVLEGYDIRTIIEFTEDE